MRKLIRHDNADGSFYYTDANTGEKIEVDANKPKHKNSSLSGMLNFFGIIYFLASIIISIIFFVNSTTKINSIFGETTETNLLVVSTGVIILIQGVVIILICLALSRLLETIYK